ncbi:anti-phage-associated DUF499 domain-containing protein [Thioalkalivibrio sp. ALE21]|uniref:anti-phage-associated DUF499 domain-containing protein n=1 Tax=Thioalkalivibrio sp. ALE21 TaxID=1158175 RepID=UPI000DA18576|nr:anti-phage-associated DUF499 domain-containing protein [Thioalkalivibrio sp. ALE21]
MLKTVKDACTLHPATMEYQSAEGVEELASTVRSDDRGAAFFQRNYMTQGMEALLDGGLRRLAGQSGQAVFELAQAMGGGKTHLMSALGLLARYPEHRADILSNETQSLVGDVTARVAVFDGRNSHPKHLWGSLAEQLGDEAVSVLKPFWEDNAAPGKDDWIQALGDEPALILMDELPPYLLYASTRAMGAGTLADVVTRAVANLFEAALAKPNCCVVLSNLANTYTENSGQISRLVKNLQSETNRQATSITPVALNGDEIYAIIRKRLFIELPDESTIGEVAEAFADQVRKAEDSGYFTARSIVQIEEEIRSTYPFHPRFKHLAALFKDNPNFRETRGLLEFSARLVRSVWNRDTNDVYLIGTQHLDLNDSLVFSQVNAINQGLRNAVARDISDKGSSHAEAINDQLNSDAGTQVANLILSASLSESVQGHTGLHEHEVIEYLIDPQRKPDEFKAAITELRKTAWYLHTDASDNLRFKDTENLIKRLQNDSGKLPQDWVDDQLRKWLERALEPRSKQAYQNVLVMPSLDAIADAIKHDRVLVVAKPDGGTPPEDIQRFFDSVEHKNNLLVLTSHDSHLLGDAESRFRELLALERIQKDIHQGGNEAQIREAGDLKETTEEGFIQSIQSVFNRLYYPGSEGFLAPATIDNGLKFGKDEQAPEAQIEKYLASTRCDQKLIMDLDGEMDSVISMAESMLWREGQKREPWKDIRMRAAAKPEWPWLPGSKGLDQVKASAFARGMWREGNDGYIEKGPFAKEQTSVSVTPKSTDEATGELILQLVPKHSGNTPRVHYCTDEGVSEQDPVADSLEEFRTTEPTLYFLAVDPDGNHETGDATLWKAPIKIRHEVHTKPDHRVVELQSTPKAALYYTTDGSGPREGFEYTGPFPIEDGRVLVQVYAKAGASEQTEKFTIQPSGDNDGRPEIDPHQPVRLQNSKVRLDTTQSVFQVLVDFKDRNVSFTQVRLQVGEGEDAIEVNFNSRAVTPAIIESTIESLRKATNDSDAEVQMFIRNGGGDFATGEDLKRFAEIAGLQLKHDNVSQ